MIDTADKKSFDQRFKLIRTLHPDHLVPEEEESELTIMDLEQGGFFTCFGDTYYVKEKNTYQETSEDFSTPQDFTVTELTCISMDTGANGHFEWEYDDELEVSITLNQINFRRLTDDEGQVIDGDDLEQIAEDEDAIVYAGEKFYYEDDWAAIYKRGDKEEQVFMYEFENETGTQAITIEEWTGASKDEYRIYISKPIIPEEITIMSKGTPGGSHDEEQQ